MNPDRLAGALAAATISAAVVLVGAPAQATTPERMGTTVVNGKHCADRGATNYYVHHWQAVHPWRILHSPYVFGEHRCRANGFRLYKSTSNTAGEVRFARHFLKTDRPKQPTVFCRTSQGHAYFLDLAFYWGMPVAKHLNAAERTGYNGWAHTYADRHGCHLFEPKGAR